MAIGCKFLSRTKLNLTTLKLSKSCLTKMGIGLALLACCTSKRQNGENLGRSCSVAAFLSLDGNKLADNSLKYLVRADWNPLNSLILCISALTQPTTLLRLFKPTTSSFPRPKTPPSQSVPFHPSRRKQAQEPRIIQTHRPHEKEEEEMTTPMIALLLCLPLCLKESY